jgi:hypothetical protein
MMFCVTVHINMQKSKVISLEYCYELRHICLIFLHFASSLQIIISTCQTNYSWGPSCLIFLLKAKVSTSPTQNTLLEYILNQMQAVHAVNSCPLVCQITAYCRLVSTAVLPGVAIGEECDIYKCVSITRWLRGPCSALLALVTLHAISDSYICEC